MNLKFFVVTSLAARVDDTGSRSRDSANDREGRAMMTMWRVGQVGGGAVYLGSILIRRRSTMNSKINYGTFMK